MTKQYTPIVAGIKAASKGNPAFVLASNRENLPATEEQLDSVLASTEFSKFDCVACGTSMQAIAGTEPFCVTCGSGDGHVYAAAEKPTTEVNSKSDLVSLSCTVCDHVTSMEADVVKAITASKVDGKPSPVHCSSCGNPMYLAAELVDEAAPPADPTTVPNAEVGEADLVPESVPLESSSTEECKEDEKMTSSNVDEVGDLDGDGDVDADDVRIDDLNSVEGSSDSLFDVADLSSPNGGEDELTAGDDSLELEPFSIEEDAPVEVSMADGPEDEDDDDLDGDEDFDLDDGNGDPLADAMEMDDTEIALSFVKAGNRVVAMKGHVAIASISKNSEGSGAALVNSKALTIAAMAAVQALGMRKGLLSLGFSPIRVPVATEATVARKIEEFKATAASKEQATKKAFVSTFALAAAGLNRGNWKGFDNPLRAAMEQELSRAGVENPRRVVAAVFESAGVAYAKTLLEVSHKLSKMSASARTELSEMLNMTQITASDADDEFDSEDPDAPTTVESRFSRPALLRPKEATSVTASAAAEVLAGKASLTFSF